MGVDEMGMQIQMKYDVHSSSPHDNDNHLIIITSSSTSKLRDEDSWSDEKRRGNHNALENRIVNVH